MDTKQLKYLGNIEQIAGIREATLRGGRADGVRIAEVHNAAGLRYTVVPDRGMDLYDLSYKGINLSFQSKNGLLSPYTFSPQRGEFSDQWSGGALVTCGLDNVGGHSENGGTFPTHGRFGYLPASSFGAFGDWEGEEYRLRLEGEVHQTKLYGRHLSLRRRIETGWQDKTILLQDRITNHEATDEPFMLLYHCNFGYPLLQEDSVFAFSPATVHPLKSFTGDPAVMTKPCDEKKEDLYLFTDLSERACGVLYNRRLGLGVYVAFPTKHLPCFQQWKHMKSHDYVLAIEPCNTMGLSRDNALAQGVIPTVPAYSSLAITLEIGVLDGNDEIDAFLATQNG